MQLITILFKKVDNVQIGNVVVDSVGFKDIESASMCLKQKPVGFTPLI